MMRSTGTSELGNRIHQQRVNRGWSQRELAEQIRTSRQYIGGVESGKYSPTTRSLIRFCVTFQCSADYLLFGEGE